MTGFGIGSFGTDPFGGTGQAPASRTTTAGAETRAVVVGADNRTVVVEAAR